MESVGREVESVCKDGEGWRGGGVGGSGSEGGTCGEGGGVTWSGGRVTEVEPGGVRGKVEQVEHERRGKKRVKQSNRRDSE